MSIPSKIKKFLEKNKINFEIISHKKVYTAYDLAQTTRTKLDWIVKTLFVKVDKDYYLVLLPASRRLNFSKLKKLLKAKKIKIASEKEMAKRLKIKPGAITPFASIYGLKAVLDNTLKKVKAPLFGTGSFTESLRLKIKDFITKEEPIFGVISDSAGLKLQVKKITKKKKKKAKTSAKKRKSVQTKKRKEK